MLIQLYVPLIQGLTFFLLLRAPKGYFRQGLQFKPVHFGTAAPIPIVTIAEDNDDFVAEIGELLVPSMYILPTINKENPQKASKDKRISMKEHIMDEIHYVPSISKYIIPLGLNYFFNFFTNQALVLLDN